MSSANGKGIVLPCGNAKKAKSFGCYYSAQLGSIAKTRQKSNLKKLVKLPGYTCACNSLTNFEYEAHSMTGNGNQVNLLKLAWEIL